MPSPSFVGRAEELEALKSLLTRARNAAGGALVIRGEPGIGKTALLEAATSDLGGMTLIRVDGFEAELTMPYAGLQRVGVALADHLQALPDRQRQALLVAWGSADGPPPDRFLVGMGMLGLFAAAGSQRPVVCVIDDTHWLDSESRDVVAFVARRLQAESTALLLSTRDTEESRTHLAGIPALELGGLDPQSAIRLLTSAARDSVDPYAAARIAEVTGGHPLALLDLTRDLSARQLTQLSLSPAPAPIGNQLEAHYLQRTQQLPANVRCWLSLAAAEPSAHYLLIAHAAEALNLSAESRYEAERSGLVSVGDHVVFRHPLVRSAVYGAMSGAERRRIHSALSSAAADCDLADLEAWHAAAATEGTDGIVATRLAVAADRAGQRGGLVSRARLMTRAAELTPVGSDRDDRLLAAARAAVDAGAAQLALDLLERLDADRLDPVRRARFIMIRTEVGLFTADSALIMRGPADLIAAADLFHGREPEAEQVALVRAYELMLVAEVLMQGTSADQLGRRIRAGADVMGGPRSAVMHGIAAHLLDPYAEAVPAIRTALDTLETMDDDTVTGFGFIGVPLATALFDRKAGSDHLHRLADIARDAGALRSLDMVLWVWALFELDHGNPRMCGEYVRQVRDLRVAIGYDAEHVVNVAHLAWTGAPREDLVFITDAVRQMGFGGVYTSATTAIAIRDIAEGRYLQAYQTLLAFVDASLFQVAYIRYADFVEAAVRSGNYADAGRIADRIAEMAAATGSRPLRGLDHRCRGLLSDDDAADHHYRRAIELLGEADALADLGRAHLLYGEWLRRGKRRREAREQLRSAVAIFDRIDAPAFAERARGELAATGERTTERRVVAGVEMSPQEAAVARMAAEGHTNAEIGATLFISTNTVDYHLRKVFTKLGVSSRRQLSERFTSEN